MEYEFSARSGCVNVFRKAFEANVSSIERTDRLNEMLKGSAKAVQPPNGNGVSCANVGDRLIEPLALCLCPACGVGEDFGAASFLERVQLQIQGLVSGRDP